MSAENYFPDELSRDEFVRGPRRCDYASNLEWFTEQRTLAESVLCPQCRSVAGQTCVNPITKQPLKRFPAHEVRLRAAQKKQETPK